MSYSDLPLSDAILVENGAVTRIVRIVRAIERNKDLADMYNTAGLSEQLIKAAVFKAEGRRVTLFGQRNVPTAHDPDPTRFSGRYSPKGGRDPEWAGQESNARSPFFNEGAVKPVGWPSMGKWTTHRGVEGVSEKREYKSGARKGQTYGGKAFKRGYCTVSVAATHAIARALRIGEAYKRGLLRKRMYLYGTTTGLKFGAKQLKRGERPDMGGYATAGFYGKDSPNADKHAEFRQAKKDLRAKHPGKEKDAAYYEELRNVTRASRKALSDIERQPDWSQLSGYGPRGSGGAAGGATGGGSDDKRKLSIGQLSAMAAAYRKAHPGTSKSDSFAAIKAGKSNPLWESDSAASYDRGYAHSNPFGYDDLALVTNPSSGIGFLDSIENTISNKVPVIGEYIAPLLAPAALAAAGFGVHLVLIPRVRQYLPEQIRAYASSAVGLLAGIAGVVVYNKATNQSTRNAALATGAALFGAGVLLDLNKKFGSPLGADSDYGAVALDNPGMFGSDEFGAVALDNPGMFGAVALDNPGMFGDGMAYQLGRTSGYGFDGATQALTNSYSGASLADAYFSGPDFDAVEGEALLSGAAEFGRLGGAVSHNAAGPSRHQSNMAGRRFHRWGWLVKLIGFENAQKIAALPPEQRLVVIDNMRKQALAAYQSSVASSTSSAKALSVGPSAFGPPGASAPGAVGDAFGYGALAVADY